jgi:hypothetical protein
MSLANDLKDPKYNIFAQGETKKVTKDKDDELRQTLAFENGIKMLLGLQFGGMASGFDVRFEGKKFRPSQYGDVFLKDIKDQLTGKEAKVAEIFFHGKYLGDVDESMIPEQVEMIITIALNERIKKEAII